MQFLPGARETVTIKVLKASPERVWIPDVKEPKVDKTQLAAYIAKRRRAFFVCGGDRPNHKSGRL